MTSKFTKQLSEFLQQQAPEQVTQWLVQTISADKGLQKQWQIKLLLASGNASDYKKLLTQALPKKDLLVTPQMQLQHRPDAPAYNIGGIYTVDEQKLNALSDEDYLDLRRQGIIPLIYAHLSSLQQLRRISEMQYNADKAGETDS